MYRLHPSLSCIVCTPLLPLSLSLSCLFRYPSLLPLSLSQTQTRQLFCLFRYHKRFLSLCLPTTHILSCDILSCANNRYLITTHVLSQQMSCRVSFAIALSPYNTCLVMSYLVMCRLLSLCVVLSCSCVHSLACSHAHTRSPTHIQHYAKAYTHMYRTCTALVTHVPHMFIITSIPQAITSSTSIHKQHKHTQKDMHVYVNIDLLMTHACVSRDAWNMFDANHWVCVARLQSMPRIDC